MMSSPVLEQTDLAISPDSQLDDIEDWEDIITQQQASILQDLALSFTNRYEQLGDLEDMEAALQADQAAVALTPSDHPNRADRVGNLAISLNDRYRRLGKLGDLETALQRKQEAAALTPDDHPDRAYRLQGLAVSFRDRYQRFGELKDLEAALDAEQQAVGLTPHDHPNRAHRLQGLAASFRDRYQRLGELKDLEAALQRNQEAVALTPSDHPDRASRLQGLAVSFRDRYQRFGELKDLEAALQQNQEAVGLTPQNHPDRAGRLQGLAALFRDRYQRLGELKDLEAALQQKQEAVALTPNDHPDRAYRLQGLAVSVRDRYQRLGELKDLEAALQQNQEAVGLTPQNHPDRAGRLQGLAWSFRDRYQRLGELKDLEAALQQNQEAAALTPHDHPDWAARLQGLGVMFTDRYQRLGELKDLEAALDAEQQAVGLTPHDHPNRAHRLQGLAASFRDRYQRLGELKDLEAALQQKQEAVALTPSDHPSRAQRLQGLAVSFTDRYQLLGDLKDLEAALYAHQQAAALTPDGHPDRASRLQGLAVSFKNRYKCLGELKDLEAALDTIQGAVGLTPHNHPHRAHRLQTLATFCILRFRNFGNLLDLQAVHCHYLASFESPSSTPMISWAHALSWASFSQEFDQDYCIPAYLKAFALLPEISWIGHDIHVRQGVIHRLDIADTTSKAVHACIQQSQLLMAVELLEQGLATIFQQMLQLRPELKDIPPEYGPEFQALSLELYVGNPTNSITVVEKRNELLQKIRGTPGSEHFLLPRPGNVLCCASQGGPVIILTSHPDQCGAIIVRDPVTEPIYLPLSSVSSELLESQQKSLKQLLGRCNARDRGQSFASRLFGRPEGFSLKPVEECFKDLLTWLWSNIVHPVYQVLKSHGVLTGRIWWLLTGAFTNLPVHACSPTDDFIHSYTTTLGSLLDAYAKTSNIPPELAVVGVTHTDCMRGNFLGGVQEEAKQIISIVKSAPVYPLIGSAATVDAVKAQLQRCSWVHLGCHGIQSPGDPTVQSHLKLYEGDLDLETILRLPLPNAQFMFLAACQTAMGDAKMINESFHLGGGFMTAGFRSVIGTMWSMNDSDGPVVAKIVYSHLFRDGQEPLASDAAKALHLAVRELKRRGIPYERWVPFIHMGI
ncbi:CHAT domain-containing protein [Mycena vitilis]|nr:CHAT domain-containing protein [Mycena vitilis]